MKKNEIYTLTIGGIIWIGLILLYFLVPECSKFQELVILLVAVPPSIVAAVLTQFLSRHYSEKKFKKMYPLDGRYHKFNQNNELERLGNHPLMVDIKYIDMPVFEIVEEFSNNGQITKSIGYFGIENLYTGIAKGNYKHNEGFQSLPDAGLYDIFIESDKNKFKIWIGFENLYPFRGKKGSYYLEKI